MPAFIQLPLSFLLLLIFSLIFLSDGYHLGGDDVMCWVTDVQTKEQVLLSSCPPQIESAWIKPPPYSFSIRDPPPQVEWSVTVGFATVNSSGFPTTEAPHTNLHSCITAEVNFCTPNVKATPGLNTQTPAQKGDLVNGTASFSAELLLGFGNQSTRTTWTVLAHTRIYTFSNTTPPRLQQWDFAIGLTSTVYNEPQFEGPSDALVIAIYVITAIEMSLVVATVILMLVKLQHTIIRASSPVFLIWMCLFALIGMGAVYTYGQSPQTKTTCLISIWFAGVGFIGVFAPLLAKTFRLYRIFSNQNLKGVQISNLEVAGYSCLLMLPEVVIFIIWSAADPPMPTRDYNADISYTVLCESDVNDLWIALISTYQLLVLMVGLVLAYLSRQMVTLFNESTYISYSIVIMLGAAILAPVQFTNSNNPDSVFVLQAVQVMLYGLVIYIICWPKLFRILRGDEPNLNSIMISGRNTARGSTRGSSRDSLDESNSSGNLEVGRLFKNGELRASVRKSLLAIHRRFDPIYHRIAAGDAISESQLQPFLEELQSFYTRHS